MLDKLLEFAKGTGFYLLFGQLRDNWGSLLMILVSLFLLWLGIKKKFEPLLLIGIAFGMLLTNLLTTDTLLQKRSGIKHENLLEFVKKNRNF